MAESSNDTEENSKGRYEFEGRVRYSEIDHRGTMTLPALINYFQDCQYIPVGSNRARDGQAET